MPLPGGTLEAGAVARDFAFRPVTGRLELSLADAGRDPGLPAVRVTRALAAALAHVGGRPVDDARARGLSVGDRQYLVRQLAAHLGRDRVWLHRPCAACGALMDVPVTQSAMPVKPAGEGYPSRAFRLGGRPVRLRAPTGEDQEKLCNLPEDDALRAWVDLLVECEGGPAPAGWTPAELAQIEAWIEEISPEVSLAAEAICPSCGAPGRVEVDPYLCLAPGPGHLLEEIHSLAMAYHWSEEEILDLPRARRRHYLALIDRSRGLMSREPA